MKIFYNFATRSRPEKFFKVLDNISSLARHDDYVILVSADSDDLTMFNREVQNRVAKYDKVHLYYGTSRNKIDAINRLPRLFKKYDILVNVSDDQLFLMEGFDLEIVKDMTEYFPDTDGFLFYPDSHAKQFLPTMSIMGKKYYDRFDFVYHPDYANVYCDNEALAVAELLGKIKFIDKAIFDHYHPAWGMAAMDDQYRISENPESYWKDKGVFELRKANNFYL